MDFNIEQDRQMLMQGMKDVLTKEFNKEYFRKLDDNHQWPYEPMRALGKLGYLGLTVSEEYGGYGGNAIDSTLGIEVAAHYMGGPAMAYFTTVCFGTRAIAEFGTDEQKKNILPGLLSGDDFMALGLTEPDGGTDILNAMKSTAKPDGKGNWIINGAKIFTTGATEANWIIAVVRTSGFEEKRAKGVTMFLVPLPNPAVTIEPIPIFCHNATGANHVTFDNVVVPEANMFGPLDKALFTLFGVLNDERIGASAMCLGLAEAAFDEALEYSKQRIAFKRPIGQFQAVQHTLADSWAKIQAMKYMVYNAAWLEANHLPCEMESSATKLFCSINATQCIRELADILGGYQATSEFSMAYYKRDCEFTYAPVINNACKNLIGERLGLPKSY